MYSHDPHLPPPSVPTKTAASTTPRWAVTLGVVIVMVVMAAAAVLVVALMWKGIRWAL